jgi:hypothetical protein
MSRDEAGVLRRAVAIDHRSVIVNVKDQLLE